jgi:PKD repeat protein
VDVTDGEVIFQMRIDADTDIFGTDSPEGVFNVIGIGGQFDSSDPFDSGYQFIPRYLEDISETVFADFTAPGTWDINNGPISFDNESSGADSYEWQFGDDITSSDDSPEHEYDSPGTYTIILIATSDDILCSDTATMVIEILSVSVDDIPDNFIVAYPNPTIGVTTIDGVPSGASIGVYDAVGRHVDQFLATGGIQLVDLSERSAGWYLVEIEMENARFHIEIIKQ